MLQHMLQCGEQYELELADGNVYPFGIWTQPCYKSTREAVNRCHVTRARLTWRSRPDGQLFVCHRFVGDQSKWMGKLTACADRLAGRGGSKTELWTARNGALVLVAVFVRGWLSSRGYTAGHRNLPLHTAIGITTACRPTPA